MNTSIFSSLFLLVASTLSSSAFAVSDPLLGTWKTIDDRTGYSLSNVVIRKDKANQYSATITEVRAVPGAESQNTCSKCTGSQKNMPLVGMTTLKGLTIHPSHENEFINGVLLDPKSGEHYAARARLISNGKHLIIHGRSDGSSVGRNITWVKN